jgi:hypothetical protein
VVPHVLEDVAVQIFCGSGALSATAVQIPGVADRLQAMHALAHAFPQQTPWAQKVDWHSVPRLHFAPMGLSPQLAFSQTFPATHCVSLLQVS